MQTRLERLVEKKLVAKNKQRPAVYSANVAPEEVRANMVDSLLGRIAGVVPLFAHLVQDPSLSAADLPRNAAADRRRRAAHQDSTGVQTMTALDFLQWQLRGAW